MPVLVLTLSRAPKPLPGAKTVNNNKPKPATSKPARAAKSRRGGGRTGAGRPGREKRKTADELDADMADYFDGGNSGNTPANNATTQAAQATNGGDIGMDDDVLVGTL